MSFNARPLWIVIGLALIILGIQGKLGTALAALLSPGDVEVIEQPIAIDPENPGGTGGGSGGGSFD